MKRRTAPWVVGATATVAKAERVPYERSVVWKRYGENAVPGATGSYVANAVTPWCAGS